MLNQQTLEKLHGLALARHGGGLSRPVRADGDHGVELRGTLRLAGRSAVELATEPGLGAPPGQGQTAASGLGGRHRLPLPARPGPRACCARSPRTRLGCGSIRTFFCSAPPGSGRAFWLALWPRRPAGMASPPSTRGLPNCFAIWRWPAPTAVCAFLLARLARLDVLVVDDWAMAPLADTERRDFLEICEDRYQLRSMILTSQLPVANWHEQIGDPTLADSCSSPIRCARHEKDFFLLGASSSVWDCRLICRPAKDARRKSEPCLGRVTRKSVWSSEDLLLSLRCHCITMVQPAESRKGLNLAFTRRANFCRPTCWRVLRESKMSSVLVIVE